MNVGTSSQYRDVYTKLIEESELDDQARHQDTEDAYEPVSSNEQLE